MAEKYIIEVSEKFVEIRGNLLIREVFDFLNFFEREGYGILIDDTEIILKKGSAEEERKSLINSETLQYLEEIREENKLLTSESQNKDMRIKDLESLILQMGKESTEVHEKFKKLNEKMDKIRILKKLREDKEVCKILGSEESTEKFEEE